MFEAFIVCCVSNTLRGVDGRMRPVTRFFRIAHASFELMVRVTRSAVIFDSGCNKCEAVADYTDHIM